MGQLHIRGCFDYCLGKLLMSVHTLHRELPEQALRSISILTATCLPGLAWFISLLQMLQCIRPVIPDVSELFSACIVHPKTMKMRFLLDKNHIKILPTILVQNLIYLFVIYKSLVSNKMSLGKTPESSKEIFFLLLKDPAAA